MVTVDDVVYPGRDTGLNCHSYHPMTSNSALNSCTMFFAASTAGMVIRFVMACEAVGTTAVQYVCKVESFDVTFQTATQAG